MSGVDNRIVTMQFNNRQFEQGARTSMTTLQKLKESMSFGSIVGGTIRGLDSINGALSKIGLKTPFAPLISGANKGLTVLGGTLEKMGMKNPFASGIQGASDLQRAAQAAGGPAGMGVLEGGITSVSGKFIALSTIAITALSNITNKAVNATTTWLKSFTVAPILDGLKEYETTLQSIQTVQANTDQPLPKIEKALKELNDYSDTTIYNFGEMAKNVGTFTAAGVNLKDSVASIRGIANVAALSGSNSQQAAGAMYQLSQAIAAGKVGAQDWNSVVNAGMAGKKLQTALAQTAVAMGALDKTAVTTNKSTGALMVKSQSFKNSIMASPGQESWLTSGVLVNTLATLDGRFSKAYQLSLLNEDGTKRFTAAQVDNNMALARANLEKKNGVKFSDAQYKDLLKMAEASTRAAQDVKTLGQVFDIAKETIGSGWSASFKSIFGNLEESKTLFTEMSNGLNDIIGQNALARNELLAGWKEGGGRALMIEGLKSAWTAFSSVIKAVSQGFRDIFPKKTSADLIQMTASFSEFMRKLIPGKKTLANIRDIAGGFFAVLGIGKTLLGGVITLFKTMFSAIGAGDGDFLGFVANIGDMVKKFNEFLTKSGIVTAFFTGLGNLLAIPIALLKGLGGIITDIFGGFDEGKADVISEKVGKVSERFEGLQSTGSRIQKFFEKVGKLFGNIGKTIGEALVGIGDTIAGMFTADTFGATLDVINTTLLGGLVLMIRNFFNKGVNIDLTGGLFDGIKETLGAATGAFENMQKSLKASILMKIALAIGVLALALLVLSTIDPASLTKALFAMGAGFGVLIAATAALMKTLGTAGIVQLYVVTSAMTKMALSILLLAFALKVLAGINFGDMLRGLVGLAAMMFILTKAMAPLAANSKGMAKASFSMILMGIAINILAVALKILATMSWEEMIRGLAGLTGVLVALAVGLKLMPDLKAEAVGLIALGISLNLIAVAMKIFATMSWEELAKGVLAIAGALLVISLAINTMPKTMMLQAAALVLVAGSLVVLAGALKIMASMGWDDIGRGLAVLAGSLLILAVGLNAIGIVGTIGALGLMTAAKALAVFSVVMLALGSMSWKMIIKSLTALAGIFVILGIAGYVLAPVVLVIMGLGVALLFMGAGLALAGAGALAAATAFAIVVAAGSAGIQILVALLASIIAAIPPALKAFGMGIVLFAVAIGKGAPAIGAAFGRILQNLLDQVILTIPKVGTIIMRLVDVLCKILVQGIPKIANAGLRMIIGLLTALRNKLPKIIDLGADIVIKFMEGIGRNAPRLADSAAKMILKLMGGLAKVIRERSKEFGEKGADIALAIVEGTVKGLVAFGDRIKDKLLELAKKAWNGVKDFFGVGSPSKLMRDTVGRRIPEGMALGIKDTSGMVVRELGDLGTVAVSSMSEAMRGINDAFALDPNLNPTITPVLDLTAMTQEANKMSSILATAPIRAAVSYETAADISALTKTSAEARDDAAATGKGNTYVTLEQNLNSPKPIDSVESYRAGKTLISLAKEALS